MRPHVLFPFLRTRGLGLCHDLMFPPNLPHGVTVSLIPQLPSLLDLLHLVLKIYQLLTRHHAHDCVRAVGVGLRSYRLGASDRLAVVLSVS